ncbi:MAG TPA: hypothetical protein PLX17_00460 [Chitinophagaceae bacterium]|nr:hypothetical protein [Chitinophagaceae bacterium]
MRKPIGRFSETQRKVQAILAMPEPVRLQKKKTVCVNEIVSVLNRFDNKIELALYLSK